MLCFMFFGVIWLVIFITDKVRFIVMSSAAQFYFDSNRTKEGSASVCSAGYLATFKHSGSIALGSLIHTLIFILKIIVEIVNDEAAQNDNCAAKVLLCLIKCCVSCLESMIEYLNTMAYAMMAITGDRYCTSAWNGFLMNLKHCVKFYFASSLASGFVLIGMICVVAANMGTTWLLIQYAFPEGKSVINIWNPLGVTGIFTFFIAFIFIGPFDDAVTATIMCLAVDLELNNGEPKHGPPSYHSKLDAIFNDDNGEKRAKLIRAHDPEINIHGGFNNQNQLNHTHPDNYNGAGLGHGNQMS